MSNEDVVVTTEASMSTDKKLSEPIEASTVEIFTYKRNTFYR